MTKIQHFNPNTLIKNPAFTAAVVVPANARTNYIGGIDANTPGGEIVGKGDLAAQTGQVFKNLRAAFISTLANPDYLVEMDAIAVIAD